MRNAAIMAVLLASGLVACGQAGTSSTASGPGATSPMRYAAVRLVLADVNATALPRACDRRTLRQRMSRYVGSAALQRRVASFEAAVRHLGGSNYVQAWTDAITVGRWEGQRRRGDRADVVFLAYETVTVPGDSADDLPMERFTVRMAHERGSWRLLDYDKRWLTPAGPMGQVGADTISSLPERAVFKNPRPGASGAAGSSTAG